MVQGWKEYVGREGCGWGHARAILWHEYPQSRGPVIQNECAFWFSFGCGLMGAMGPDGMSRLDFFWVSLSMGPFFSNGGAAFKDKAP